MHSAWGPNMAGSQPQPLSLVMQAQHPTIQTRCPAKVTPKPGPLCLAREKPGWGRGEAGRVWGEGSRVSGPRDPSLPSQAQGSQGCCPSSLGWCGPNLSPSDLVVRGRQRRARCITARRSKQEGAPGPAGLWEGLREGGYERVLLFWVGGSRGGMGHSPAPRLGQGHWEAGPAPCLGLLGWVSRGGQGLGKLGWRWRGEGQFF